MPVRYWVQARLHIAISLHISEAKLPRTRPGRGQMLEAKAEAEENVGLKASLASRL